MHKMIGHVSVITMELLLSFHLSCMVDETSLFSEKLLATSNSFFLGLIYGCCLHNFLNNTRVKEKRNKE